jgi:hypothetical protein
LIYRFALGASTERAYIASMAPPAHEPVADCTLLRPDGSPLRLAEFGSGPLVLIFLRYLG